MAVLVAPLVELLALLGREHLAYAMHALRAQDRKIGERLRLRIGRLAGTRLVEALGSGELRELVTRRLDLLHLLVKCRRLFVEDLEYLVALRFAQVESAQVHHRPAAMVAHVARGHVLRRCRGRDAERGAACEQERGDMSAAYAIHFVLLRWNKFKT